MNNFTVIYDACVLYPAPLRDLLMHLALTDLFRAKWTNEIHDEWIGNVLRNRPDLDRIRLERTREKMNSHVRDCLVSGYEDLIDAIQLPDERDRHVVAAAIKCGADLIVTFNLKDFPASAISKYGIEALHPDQFVICQLDIDMQAVCTAAKRQRENLKNPPQSVEEFLSNLESQGLPKTVSILRKFSELI